MTDSVNNNLEKDLNVQQVKNVMAVELIKKLAEYRKTMAFMAGDAPISILGLPKNLEKVLLSNGLDRIYDLFDRDFTKIEGLSDVRISYLTTRIDEFLSML